MLRQDIIQKIAKATGLSPQAINKVLRLFAWYVIYACVRGERVILKGFGIFELVRHKPTRKVMGEHSFDIGARSICKFHPGKNLHFTDEQLREYRGRTAPFTDEGEEG